MPYCTIVGAGPRMGAGVARAYSAAGYDLVLVSRKTGATDPVARELTETGGAAQFLDLHNESAGSWTWERHYGR